MNLSGDCQISGVGNCLPRIFRGVEVVVGEVIKAWYQWSEEEWGEDEGRGKWEDVSATIDFSAGHNVYGGDGGPVEGRES